MTTGSLVNQVMADATKRDFVSLGDGATILMHSDRHAATVVAIRRYVTGPKKGQVREVITRRDTATIVKGSSQDGSAKYEYADDPDGEEQVFLLNRKGMWKSKSGDTLHIGSRAEYYDPHF